MIQRQILQEDQLFGGNSDNRTQDNGDNGGNNENSGYLSFDLGYKHMTAAFTFDFIKHDIFLFDMDPESKFCDRLKQLKLNINQIIILIGKQNIQHNTTPIQNESNNQGDLSRLNDKDYFNIGKSKIKYVIIEEQVQTNIQALNIMYAVGTYFEIHQIKYCIQPARLKYKFFENRDSKQFKNLSAQYVGGMLDDIQILYQNYDIKTFQNHKWMSQELRDWLLENKIDKADDIGDVILLLKYFDEQQQKQINNKNNHQQKRKQTNKNDKNGGNDDSNK